MDYVSIDENSYYFKNPKDLNDKLIQYPRVTSVVGKFKDTEALDKWKNSTPNHEEITKSAADLGKAVHAVMAGEDYVIPDSYDETDILTRASSCKEACRGLHYLHKELRLRNDKLQYAGTTDAIVKADPELKWYVWNGELNIANKIGILDYKFKKNAPWNPAYLFQYCLQLGFYSLAAKEININAEFGAICCTWQKNKTVKDNEGNKTKETITESGLWVIEPHQLKFYEEKAKELITAYHNDNFISWDMLLYEAGYLGIEKGKPVYKQPNLMPNKVKEIEFYDDEIPF